MSTSEKLLHCSLFALLIAISINIISCVDNRRSTKNARAMKRGVELNDISNYAPGRKRDILIREIAYAKIPVFIQSKKEFHNFMSKSRRNYDRSAIKNNNTIGFFEYDNYIKEWPKIFIHVDSALPLDRAITTLYHEVGHYVCYKNNCECFKQDDAVLMEFHAYMFSLKRVRDKEYLDILFTSIRDIKNMAEYTIWDNTKNHQVAARKVIETELWKDCIKFIHKETTIPAE